MWIGYDNNYYLVSSKFITIIVLMHICCIHRTMNQISFCFYQLVPHLFDELWS